MKMFKNRKKLSIMLILALCLTMFCAEPTMAATRSLKSQKFTTSLSTVQKKATLVKKGTNYKLKVKKNGAWIKFKAPATKKYTFKFSGMKSSDSYTCGYVGFYKAYASNSNYITRRNVTTQGGAADALYLASKKTAKNTTKNTFLTSRYGKANLKKGQMVYMFIYTVDNCTLNFSVK